MFHRSLTSLDLYYGCHDRTVSCVPSQKINPLTVGTPDASTIHRIISQHDVRSAFMSPSIIRILRREDPKLEAAKDWPRPKLVMFFA